MTAGWVAASVRARAMTRRRLGAVAVRRLATRTDLDEAIGSLSRGPYRRDVHPGQDLAQVQRGVVDTFLWNTRVLAGWTPRRGVDLLRAVVAPVEITNTIDHVRMLSGRATPPPNHLGTLATAWPRIARTTTADELRRVLATSAWGDPGGESTREVQLAMVAALADRLSAEAVSARPWAEGAVALMVARELAAGRPDLPARVRQGVERVLGPAAGGVTSLGHLLEVLGPGARWALSGVEDGSDLWMAEARWWGRVGRDAGAMVRSGRSGPDVVLGAAAMMAVDAWHVRAALEVAARSGAPVEVLDVLA